MAGGAQEPSQEPVAPEPQGPSRPTLASADAAPPEAAAAASVQAAGRPKKKRKAPTAAGKRRAKARAREAAPGLRKCRLCRAEVTHTLVDLGMSALRGAYVTSEQLVAMERYYPLHALVCSNCLLVQLRTSLSPADLRRNGGVDQVQNLRRRQESRRFCRTLAKKLHLGAGSLAIEVSSDGANFVEHLHELAVPVLGIETFERSAQRSIAMGIPTRVEAFSERVAADLADRNRMADVVLSSNVIAQADDLHDFVAAIARVLKPRGVVILEFPYVQGMMANVDVDAIRHDHVSYFSLSTLDRLAGDHRLKITEVQELGAGRTVLRVMLTHSASARPLNNSVARMLGRERKAGLCHIESYEQFAPRVRDLKRRLLSFLISARSSGQRIYGYGEPGCGSTLLQYCGLGPDFLDGMIDRGTGLHGKFTPGLHVPVLAPDVLQAARPDIVFVMPCITVEEAASDLRTSRDWGAKLLLTIPNVISIDPRNLDR